MTHAFSASFALEILIKKGENGPVLLSFGSVNLSAGLRQFPSYVRNDEDDDIDIATETTDNNYCLLISRRAALKWHCTPTVDDF